MGHHVTALAEGLVSDQLVMVALAGRDQQQAARVAEPAPAWTAMVALLGCWSRRGPLACWPGVDALMVSNDNAIT